MEKAVDGKAPGTTAGGLWSCWQNNFPIWRNTLSLYSERQKLFVTKQYHEDGLR